MKDQYKSGLEELAKERSLYPQESLLKIKEGEGGLLFGIPKEIALQERRVALTPEAVALLVNNGQEVCIESGAGETAKFSDKEYSEAGAKIVYSAKEVYEARIILKIEPPTQDEINFMKPGSTVFSAIQIGSQNVEYIKALNKQKITAIGFELLEDKVEGKPVIRAMSEIAGGASLLIAAEYLSGTNSGKGMLLGGVTGVPPTKVVILGAGTVAEYAARAAIGLGAEIQIFDNHLYKLRRIKHALGHQIFTSTFGNATLAESLTTADVVIGAVRMEKGKVRCFVTDEMVANMKKDSVIIDVSIDQGGCFETSQITTHERPIYRKHDVIHYCVPNLTSRFAGTASTAISNIFTPILRQMAEIGGVEEMIFTHHWFMKGVYTYKGSLTNADIAKKFNLKHTDLELLMAARL
ncbi:alanine dehydrogenase [Fulvivirgaceae bacterium BMA10]|uniref:alanine dehydrogenase n=1 Tax=Splendidivirga corallicola TaxID=3051826 RepID=A0ABT8KQW1_9BACT|nr:alanine dehydrogenase [Fulvivirgaceae bacterium BMA10]